MSIKLGCSIKVKNNYKNFNTIEQKLPEYTKQGIEEMLKNIRQTAIRIEYGHNSEGILMELVDFSENKVKGRVYTDKKIFEHAMFEHFGTGQYAEMDHIGKSKHFIESGYTEWYIPVTKVERKLNYPIVEFNGTQYYVARGAKANHFMTDAEFKTRNENKEIISKQILEMLKGACK